jgi:hypothetical protein
MTLFIEPAEVFDLVAKLRDEATPTTAQGLSAPDVGDGSSNLALGELVGVVAELPAALFAQLDVLA